MVNRLDGRVECPTPSTGSKDTVFLFWSQLICTVTAALISILDWPWKTTPKWPFECPNPSTGSKDTVIFILKSSDLYSHSRYYLMIQSSFRKYHKMNFWMSKSIHWIQRYSDIYFEVSWFVQSQLIWSNYWIGLEKLPQNDPLNVQICPLDEKIVIFILKSADLYSHSWSDLMIG